MIKLPVSEEELDRNYDMLMPEIDRLSIRRRAEVWQAWPEFVKCAGSRECLRKLHVMMFGGLFAFAGEFRTRNLAKDNFRFANVLFLDNIVPVIEDMPQSNFPEIIAKYVEMNIAHPFREGNGRVMRLWLDAMLERELNTRINWAGISRTEYMSAAQRSPVNTLELETLLQNFMLTAEKLTDKDIFLAGLSASYSYEM